MTPEAGASVAPRSRMLWLSVGVTIALELLLGRLNAPLRTTPAPLGIVSFELAHAEGVAAAIMASWNAAARETARLNLVVDYAFLIAYPISLRLGCRIVATRARDRWPRLASVAAALGWGAVVAGVLDAVENAALLRQLAAGPGSAMAAVAFWCASVKFALVAIAIPFALPALVPWPAAPALIDAAKRR